MSAVLVIITFASLAVAVGMSIVVLRMVREERLRSDARAAALARLATAEDPERGAIEEPEPVRSLRRAPQSARVHESAAGPRGEEPSGDLVLDREVSGVADLFSSPQAGSPWFGRAAVIAGLTVALACAALLLLPSRQSGGTAAAAATAPHAAPLELLSLRHSQEPDRLTISGLVQNPRGGAPLSQVTATAFLFAADGSFLASGRAPLDFTTLAAGDESPFVITVPVTGTVARYRVSFRDRSGRVIGHIDRRSGEALARNE